MMADGDEFHWGKTMTDTAGEARRVRLCSLLDLPIRGGRLFEDAIDGIDVLLFRLEGGDLVAYDAACPHAGALLRPENEMRGVLVCSLHQWQFEIATGACLTVARCPLTEYDVEVSGLDVFVTITIE